MSFDENGLLVKRYNEIVTDIQDAQIATIPTKFKYQNNKLIHQLNSVYARETDSLAELVEAAFDSIRLGAAEGVHLEEIALVRGVYRLEATPSFTSTQFAWLATGSVIPSGTLFTSNTGTGTAVNVAPVKGVATSCSEAVVTINTAVDLDTYTLTVNGTDYTFIADADATIEEIQLGLESEFVADGAKTWTYTLEDATGFLLVADTGTLLNIESQTTLITIPSVKVIFYIQLTALGNIEILANTMDGIQGSVLGFQTTNNTDAFTAGRDLETDEELRSRVVAGPVGDCTGTVLSITASLLENVSGVGTVNVVENTDTSPVDADGRPLHSYEVVVLGGTDEDVAQDVWRTKPIGIGLFGNTTEPIIDSSGEARVIKFSRPVAVTVEVEVTYSVYAEEAFPVDGDTQIKNQVLAFINSRPLGKDVIAGRLYNPIYANIQGVGKMNILIQESGGGGLAEDNVVISDAEYAYCELSDITTVVV